MKKFKVGTIGTSWITENFIQAMISCDYIDDLFVYSRTIHRAKDFISKYDYSIMNVCDDLFNNTILDIVYIASPNSLHADHANAVSLSRRNIIIEKPITLNSEDLLLLKEKVNANGGYLFEALKPLYRGNIPDISGRKIHSVKMDFAQRSSKIDAFNSGNIATSLDQKYGGGALNDLGVYVLATSLRLFGKWENVKYKPIYLANGVDGGGTLEFVYKDFSFTSFISKVESRDRKVTVLGEDFSLVLSDCSEVNECKKTGVNEVTKIPAKSAMAEQVSSICEAILNDDRDFEAKIFDQTYYIAKEMDKLRVNLRRGDL